MSVCGTDFGLTATSTDVAKVLEKIFARLLFRGSQVTIDSLTGLLCQLAPNRLPARGGFGSTFVLAYQLNVSLAFYITADFTASADCYFAGY